METKKKTLIRRIAESFGFSDKRREEKPTRILSSYSSMYTLGNDKRLKMNYDLTNAIYFGQKYSDAYDFTLGSAFGKPIVNVLSSFVVGNTPTVKLTPKRSSSLYVSITEPQDLAYGTDKLNEWIKKNDYLLYENVKNAAKDGDAYILLEDPWSPEPVDPREVSVLFDEDTGEKVGYRIKRDLIIEDLTANNARDKKITYVIEYREYSPYKIVIKYDDLNPDGVIVFTNEDDTGEKRPIPLVHWANDRQQGEIYGNSEYRNVLYPMSMYSKIFEAGIVNNDTASRPIPYASGVGDVTEFLKSYGVQNPDGSYSLVLNGKQFYINSNDAFKLGVNEIPDTTRGAKTLLELLFYLICQASETPEFLMGASVNSSHASVDSQMPIIIKKAARKQKEYKGYLQQTLETVAYYLQADPLFPIDYELNVEWGKIVDNDNRVVFEVAKSLYDNGAITLETFAYMLGANNYVEDVEEEIKKAQKEKLDIQRNLDVYSQQFNDLEKNE